MITSISVSTLSDTITVGGEKVPPTIISVVPPLTNKIGLIVSAWVVEHAVKMIKHKVLVISINFFIFYPLRSLTESLFIIVHSKLIFNNLDFLLLIRLSINVIACSAIYFLD